MISILWIVVIIDIIGFIWLVYELITAPEMPKWMQDLEDKLNKK